MSLVVPFGAIGLVGGWLTADSFHLADEAPRYLLAAVTPVVAALLGSYMTRRIGGVGAGSAPVTPSAGARWGDGAAWMDGPGRWTRRGPLMASLLALWAIGVAGVVNGMTIGLLLGPAGMIIGAAFGAVFSLPFVPALAAVLLAANRVGRARAGSIVAGADRRAVWAATSMVIALAVLTGRALFGAPLAPELGRAVAAMGLATVGALFVVDAVALARVLTLPRGPMEAGAGDDVAGEIVEEKGEAREPGEPGEGQAAGGRSAARGGRGMGERIDLGLGEEVQIEVVRPTHAYRGTRQIARMVRGNRERAVTVLRAALARGGIALAIGAALWREPWK
ncbi:hypothetical protein BE17_36380 [Sorangium cellulosum]|uniref:Uncharacterized protein n=1 Tax=Sorangium cellulosum TaxID=56 RepID=A0A150RF14_SORCE|nr:hypothetical protein BE17_36380 [Sorangium cellulosum]